MSLPKLKISFADIAYIVGFSIPALRVQWPAAKDRLKALAQTDPDIAALVENLDSIYKRVTT